MSYARILFVRLSALGDVVTGLHLLATLRARAPSARVGWLVEERFASLLGGHPQIDSLHVFRRRLGSLPRLVRALRRQRYDLALDFQGNFKSGLLARLSGARRVVGLGPPLSREFHGLFVRERVPPPPGHRLEAGLALLDAALGPGPRAEGILPIRPEPHGGILLHPGTSRFGAFKRWPPDSFALLADRLAERLRAPVLLTAGPGERPDTEAVAEKMRIRAQIREPRNLQELGAVLAGARLVVAGDTGPAHMAAILQVPTVVLFGPKDPALFAPPGLRVRAVREGVRCSPCDLRFCPDPVCMTSLGVDRVERAALEVAR